MKPFRRGDKITVHWGNGDKSKGRVICHDRVNKYGLSIVILSQTLTGEELTETFKANGFRWQENDACHITHGWPDESQSHTGEDNID